MTKRINRSYTAEFKQDAVALVTEQGYSVPKAAASLGIESLERCYAERALMLAITAFRS
ncbi:transposase [uncultured Paraglaciecola sp.]|uniref:transposase n=1 Tax=uncultured Paraglaciecola sp. TaxID=1765024 RepID=UPI0025977894|nr:transposase [uncultured Paraglaciecola sp.]